VAHRASIRRSFCSGAFGREGHRHRRIVIGLRAGHVAQGLADDRVAFFFEDIEREGDVARGERRAVMEFDLRPDEKLIGEAVGGAAYLFGGKSVHGVRLVARALQKRGEGELHALRRVALEDVAVERIEGEEILIELPVRPDLRESPALGRIRIDVAEVREIRRIG